MYSGRAKLIFILEIRLCPPLRIFAPSPCSCNKAMASETVSGQKYSNDWGIIFSPLQASTKLAPTSAKNSKSKVEPSQGLTCSGVFAGGEASRDRCSSGRH